MGLFSFVGKAIGSVLKTGASIVTHGISDKVLSVLKGRGQAKQAAEAQQYNLQQLAAAEKLKPLVSRTRTTEGVLDEATAPVAQPRSKAEIYGRTGYSYSAAKHLLSGGTKDPTLPTTARKPSRKPAKARTAVARPAPRPARKSAGRSAPTGGLDLKKISAMWAAAGKPGKWLDYIKANSNVRKG